MQRTKVQRRHSAFRTTCAQVVASMNNLMKSSDDLKHYILLEAGRWHEKRSYSANSARSLQRQRLKAFDRRDRGVNSEVAEKRLVHRDRPATTSILSCNSRPGAELCTMSPSPRSHSPGFAGKMNLNSVGTDSMQASIGSAIRR